MGRAEAGSSKAIGNAIKAKGKSPHDIQHRSDAQAWADFDGTARYVRSNVETRTVSRFVPLFRRSECTSACSDSQAHTRSEPHMRKMLLVGPKAGQTIAEFSNQFQKEFVALLRTRHQTMRVRANAVYNEYIQDKHHVHMNATRWVTLNGFIMTLGKAGIVKVDEDEKGLWITWVDNSPKTLQRQVSAVTFGEG